MCVWGRGDLEHFGLWKQSVREARRKKKNNQSNQSDTSCGDCLLKSFFSFIKFAIFSFVRDFGIILRLAGAQKIPFVVCVFLSFWF